MKKQILITGTAGFVGFHLAKALIDKKFNVIGIDNYSKSYELKLKKLRIKKLEKYKNFQFLKKDLKNIGKIKIKKKYQQFFI